MGWNYHEAFEGTRLGGRALRVIVITIATVFVSAILSHLVNGPPCPNGYIEWRYVYEYGSGEICAPTAEAAAMLSTGKYLNGVRVMGSDGERFEVRGWTGYGKNLELDVVVWVHPVSNDHRAGDWR
jgi:hypothetical protein